MDIYEYLKKDHQKVSNLFKQFEKSPNDKHKIAFVELIIRELKVHTESEQETFYKILEQFEGSNDVALHGQKEHNEILSLIASLNKIKKVGKIWERKVIDLKKIVDHHVNEEEGKMFRAARKVLSEEDAFEIKEKMHFLKGKLLSTYKSNPKKKAAATKRR